MFLSDEGDDIVAAVVGLGFGVYSFFQGFRLLRNKRIVENTPTSKCRSVAMGLVEVAGQAVGQATIPSLIGKLPCFCSQVVVERYEKSGKNSQWKTVHRELGSISFYVQDETGRVRVDPTEAELDVPRELEYATNGGLKPVVGLTLERMTSANVSSHLIPSQFQSFCASRGVGFHGPMRFYERNLSPGDPCYVLGTAGEVPGVADEHERIVIQKSKLHPWFFIAEATQKDVLSKLGSTANLHIFGGPALTLACLGYLLYRLGVF